MNKLCRAFRDMMRHFHSLHHARQHGGENDLMKCLVGPEFNRCSKVPEQVLQRRLDPILEIKETWLGHLYNH